ncbi:MAG: hypothetical protein H7338_10540 [Candidatus Sericytochromatia bacterium]|nr:hypothetical protein [Candidatus Sericytochromatia bacterium]
MIPERVAALKAKRVAIGSAAIFLPKIEVQQVIQGQHHRVIAHGGIRIYPHYCISEEIKHIPPATSPGRPLPTGVTGLDDLLDGGRPTGVDTPSTTMGSGAAARPCRPL